MPAASEVARPGGTGSGRGSRPRSTSAAAQQGLNAASLPASSCSANASTAWLSGETRSTVPAAARAMRRRSLLGS